MNRSISIVRWLKSTYILPLMFLIVLSVSIPPGHAQYAEETQWSLPEGVKARLGKGGIQEVKYSPDGSLFAVASSIGIWLYDVATLQAVTLLTGHTGSVESVSFSPDGNTLASGSGRRDGTVRLWDVETGTLKNTLTEHTGGIYSISFSPDGNTLASADWEGTVHLWNVETGTLKNTLTGHTGRVNSVAFSPDDNTLASGGVDRIVRLWDVATGTLKNTLTDHTDIATSVAFSPDGSTLASGSRDGTVLLWDITPASSEPTHLATDVNQDGTVNILDLTLVASNFGKQGTSTTDVNGDGIVNILDLTLVAAAFGNAAAAPDLWNLNHASLPTRAEVMAWLQDARHLNRADAFFQRGILVLEQLLTALTPKETVLLPNYPNPFNPETWIPYQLAEAAEVHVSIYAVDGRLIRALVLGPQPAGMYQSRSRAAYWDGKNEQGESVASGVYFYTLKAGDFAATKKMLIRK